MELGAVRRVVVAEPLEEPVPLVEEPPVEAPQKCELPTTPSR